MRGQTFPNMLPVLFRDTDPLHGKNRAGLGRSTRLRWQTAEQPEIRNDRKDGLNNADRSLKGCSHLPDLPEAKQVFAILCFMLCRLRILTPIYFLNEVSLKCLQKLRPILKPKPHGPLTRHYRDPTNPQLNKNLEPSRPSGLRKFKYHRILNLRTPCLGRTQTLNAPGWGICRSFTTREKLTAEERGQSCPEEIMQGLYHKLQYSVLQKKLANETPHESIQCMCMCCVCVYIYIYV